MLEHYLTRNLPAGLEFLNDIVFDLRWTYNHDADELFKTIDPTLWYLTHNPWLILQTVSLDDLKKLSSNADFMKNFNQIKHDWVKTDNAVGWFKENYKENHLKTVAYFSMEFGLDESLPLYAGGLGILAGDYLKTAEDLGVPLVGIGLMYQRGYFRQIINGSSEQIEVYPYNDPHSLPVIPCRNKSGEWLRVSVTLPDRTVMLRVWIAKIGNTPLYLLDSNDPVNLSIDRGITGDLYEAGREIRLIQEIILGIGGFEVFRALGIDVNICHMNEGHAAFVVLERAYTWMQDNNSADFWQALTVTRAGNIFTTHTPVQAGFDTFEPPLIRNYLSYYIQRCGIMDEEFINIGKVSSENSTEPFNMAYLAIRGSGFINGVSKIHGEVSRNLFSGLFERRPIKEVPVTYITNGVHTPTWISSISEKLLTKNDTKSLIEKCSQESFDFINKMTDAEIWEFRMNNKLSMLDDIKNHINKMKGCCRINQEPSFLDPNALYIGLARRFTGYKRPTLLLYDKTRLKNILKSQNRPVRILISGKAHPDDFTGKLLIKEWIQFAQDPEIRNTVFFLSDYDMDIAQKIVGGIDLWINNPRRPLEASGTSGMKIIANGGLNCSILDGWWAEAYSKELGWAIGIHSSSDKYYNNDKEDAESLYKLLEESIIPEFFDKNKDGVPMKWIEKIRQSMFLLTPKYSTFRMMKEYVEKAYLPLSSLYEERNASGGELALTINEWKKRLEQNWNEIHIGIPVFEKQEEYYKVKCAIWLGAVKPQDIKVEVFASGDENNEPFRAETTNTCPASGYINEFIYETAVPNDRPIDNYTLRVIPYHPKVLTPLEFNKILWQK